MKQQFKKLSLSLVILSTLSSLAYAENKVEQKNYEKLALNTKVVGKTRQEVKQETKEAKKNGELDRNKEIYMY